MRNLASMLTTILLLTLFMTVPPAIRAQNTRANSAATRAWPAFWSKFRAAVSSGNRAGVRKMMSSPFNENCTLEGPAWSADRSIAAIGANEWKTLKKLFALGTKEQSSEGRPQRITTGHISNPRLFEMNIQLFEFRSDGKWYWLGCYCSEC